MTVRSIADKYDFLDTATEEDLHDAFATPAPDETTAPLEQMMNDIEGVIDGHEYEDVFAALALILVGAAKEYDPDPQMALGQIQLHMSAAWTMIMNEPDHMTMQ